MEPTEPPHGPGMDPQAVPQTGWDRFYHWLDHRTGIRGVLHYSLSEPIPGGARWAYIFGSGLLFLFISQVVTGVFLALYYVPSADHAHATVEYITKEVTAGSFLRSLHAHGSSAVIIVLGLHVLQVFFFGSYKGRRELLWLSGCLLAALMLGMSFTGYLLPWDQKAYFATAVGTNIASEIPVIGPWLTRFMRGGTEMGTLTLSRFFVAHVFLIPAAIFALVAMHVYLFRKAGAAGPIHEDPVHPRLPTEPFYPRQVFYDVAFTAGLIVALAVLAWAYPVELGPRADPTDTNFLPRPEWYYVPTFEWLKYWAGAYSILGILVIPGIVALLFLALPFLDRHHRRSPRHRPVAVGGLLLVLGGLVALGARSYYSDYTDPDISAQLERQHRQVEEFMRAPFRPFVPGAAPAAVEPLTDPLLVRGQEVYVAEFCGACHGDRGEGGAAGGPIRGWIAARSDSEAGAILRNPTLMMQEGGMSPLELGEEDMAALLAYLRSLAGAR
jgi:ubiquinol-cytochrome c reductase cytochrome b subunit